MAGFFMVKRQLYKFLYCIKEKKKETYMKKILQAVKELIIGLITACFSIPILICCIIIFELLDPFFRFYDTLKNNETKPPKPTDSW